MAKQADQYLSIDHFIGLYEEFKIGPHYQGIKQEVR